jgi:hypothetical protein
VIYEHGQFVAVGNGILTSTDAVTWIDRESASDLSGRPLSAVSFGNGQFVAVGDSGLVLSSPDGVRWLPQQAGTTNDLTSIAFGNGQFVALLDPRNSRSNIVTSTDGVNWTLQAPTPRHILLPLYDVAYGSGRFVAVGGYGTIVTSPDGTNWVHQPSPTGCDLGAVAYGNGQFLLTACYPLVDGLLYIVTSSDGVNWVVRYRPWGSANIAFVNGRFMAVGGSGQILQSDPIISLSLQPTTEPGALKLSLAGPSGLAYTLQTSSDLITWHNLTNIISTQPSSVILDRLTPGSRPAFYRAYAQ